MATDGRGRVLVLLDAALPARVRLYDTAGSSTEMTLRHGPAERYLEVSSATLTDSGSVLLGVTGHLLRFEGSRLAWAAALQGGYSGPRIVPAPDGSSIAVYYARDEEFPVVIAKFSPQGVPLWATTLGERDAAVTDVHVGPDGSVVVLGRQLRPIQERPERVSPRHGLTLFVATYRPDGTLCWLRTANSSDWVLPVSMAVDYRGVISVLAAYQGVLDLLPTLPERKAPSLLLARFRREGGLTLATHLGESHSLSSSIGVDDEGALWLQLVDLYPAAELDVKKTAQHCEPAPRLLPTTARPRQKRCALVKAQVRAASDQSQSGARQ